MVSPKGGQHPACAPQEKTEVISLDLRDLYVQPAPPPPPARISIYFHGLTVGKAFEQGEGPSSAKNPALISSCLGRDFREPSLISNASLLLIPKHALISQNSKEERETSLLPTCPSCSPRLLFPFTVKGLKTIVHTMLSLLEFQFLLQICSTKSKTKAIF